MPSQKSQYQLFIQEALPAMFHSQAEEFIKYASEKGLDFFKFWWRHVGERAGTSDDAFVDGLRFEITTLEQPRGHLIRLWLPASNEDLSYTWMAFYQREKKQREWFPVPRTRVLALCQTHGHSPDLVDITPRLRQVMVKNQAVNQALLAGELTAIAAVIK